MNKIWQKKSGALDPQVTDYIISKNLEADTLLLPYDIQASIAHAKMLRKVGLLSQEESENIVTALTDLKKLVDSGEFSLKQQNEDCHTAIEHFLIEKLGDTGKKVHMGRSRNDQVLVATRLMTKDKLSEIAQSLKECAQTILTFAKEYEFMPMPGYTHTQQAMPSSLGQWAGSFVESLIDDLNILESAMKLNDQNPLGSAAGFGTEFPLDREFTTQELGFEKIQANTLYCQNSRGKFESFILSCLYQIMATLGKIANDLIWFTSKEFNFFSIDDSLTTGSSIMPQKKNLDIMEVLRANVSIIMSNQIQMQSVSQNLLSGYNKDLKIIKKPLIDSLEIVEKSLKITDLLFKKMSPNEEVLINAFDKDIYATDTVNRMVKSGMPFRDAYKEIGSQLNLVKDENPIENIKDKKHIGATGNLMLDQLEKLLI